MKLRIQKLLFNNKLGLLIILLISILFSYYTYSIESKSVIYKTDLILPKQSDIYHSHLSNLVREVYQLHTNEKGNCNIGLDDEKLSNSTILQLTIEVEDNKTKKRSNELKNSLLKCESIVRMTVEQFLIFYDDVLTFIKKNYDDYNISSDLLALNFINENSEINRKKYFLEIFLNNLSADKLDLKLIYAPTPVYQHVLNGIITLLILLAVYVGFLIANKKF